MTDDQISEILEGCDITLHKDGSLFITYFDEKDEPYMVKRITKDIDQTKDILLDILGIINKIKKGEIEL